MNKKGYRVCVCVTVCVCVSACIYKPRLKKKKIIRKCICPPTPRKKNLKQTRQLFISSARFNRHWRKNEGGETKRWRGQRSGGVIRIYIKHLAEGVSCLFFYYPLVKKPFFFSLFKQKTMLAIKTHLNTHARTHTHTNMKP